MKYQFPELTWNKGSTLSTCVEHGLKLREQGRWIIPDYQRELVWTKEQKIRFIESLVLGLPIGEYTLHRNPDYTYEVLDGQQRWEAIFSYVDGKFPVFGLYWKDLNEISKRGFGLIIFAHREVLNLTYEQRVEAYTRLAYGGTPNTPKQQRKKKATDAERVAWALEHGWYKNCMGADWWFAQNMKDDPDSLCQVKWDGKGTPPLTDKIRETIDGLMLKSKK